MKYIVLFIKKTLRLLLKPLSFVPALLVMYMIFSFSAQDGAQSSAVSTAVTQRLVSEIDERFEMGWDAQTQIHYVDRLNFYVRKGAHVTEYFILAVTVAIPLYVYGVRGIWLIFCAGAICVGYAGLDEFHQSFSGGRTATIRDVGIDSIGIFPGILLSQFLCFIGRKTIFRPLSLEKKSGGGAGRGRGDGGRQCAESHYRRASYGRL
ncbi:MAG: VanZ family protein [Eubacteriales bacterium]|nr:VanZ family protein [Eubacteriales bacterium]